MYLGTDPPLNVVQVVESKEVDFEAMDAEHQQLLAKIREHTSGENKPAATDRLIMRTNVPLVCDQEDTGVRLSNPLGGDAGPSKSGAEGRSVTATVTLGYEGKGAARDVVLRVACPASVECAHPCVEFSEVRSGGTPATASLTFTHTGDMVPPNNVGE